MNKQIMISLMIIKLITFFFQAEDGIRGYKVTGVQTCALPILRQCEERRDVRCLFGVQLDEVAGADLLEEPLDVGVAKADKIGRASCRERAYICAHNGPRAQKE